MPGYRGIHYSNGSMGVAIEDASAEQKAAKSIGFATTGFYQGYLVNPASEPSLAYHGTRADRGQVIVVSFMVIDGPVPVTMRRKAGLPTTDVSI